MRHRFGEIRWTIGNKTGEPFSFLSRNTRGPRDEMSRTTMPENREPMRDDEYLQWIAKYTELCELLDRLESDKRNPISDIRSTREELAQVRNRLMPEVHRRCDSLRTERPNMEI